MECPECKADVDEERLKAIMCGQAVQITCNGCGEVFIHVLRLENWRRKYSKGAN
jgi:uncharacterized Zn finger protein